jgi:hypothetical protein
MVINDLKQPWSERNRALLEQMATRLHTAGIRILGESPLRGIESSKDDVNFAATLRLAIGQSPYDSSEAKTKVRKWMESNGELGCTLWISPSPSDPAADPILTLFKGQVDDQTWKVIRKQVQLGRAE